MTMMGMVPQPAHVLDELAAVIDQRIVNGDDAAGASRFSGCPATRPDDGRPAPPHPNQSRPASG